jgi:hypothetical protein
MLNEKENLLDFSIVYNSHDYFKDILIWIYTDR